MDRFRGIKDGLPNRDWPDLDDDEKKLLAIESSVSHWESEDTQLSVSDKLCSSSDLIDRADADAASLRRCV